MEAYKQNNKDDINKAVYGLDVFTKNFCVDCEKTDKKNDLVFNCKDCSFNTEEGKCLVKIFAAEHEHDYPLDNFGAMGMVGLFPKSRERDENEQ